MMGATIPPPCRRPLGILALIVCSVWRAPAGADVVLDGSLGGQAGALTGPNYVVPAEVGRRDGANLFHSFERFGIGTGESALFTGPGDIEHVISRVTGGEVSTIDGVLSLVGPRADFWFINPAGVVIGPNALLDVPGSFHVGTADELRLADGTRFSARAGGRVTLSAAPPEAFGFLERTPAPITVEQGLLSALAVPSGETLALVGGDIAVRGGLLSVIAAEGGRVDLAAVASPGEVRVADGATTAEALGAVELTGATVDVSGAGGGTIRVRAGRFVVDGGNLFAANRGDGPATGGIDVRADAVEVGNGGGVSTETAGGGGAGPITIDADSLLVASGGAVSSSTLRASTGDAGPIRITLDDRLEVREGGRIGSSTSAAGEAGLIDVAAESVLVGTGGEIASSSAGRAAGAGGTVRIAARGPLEVRDGGLIRTVTFGEGAAGRIAIRAGRIVVAGDEQVRSVIDSSANLGTGDAGEVVVRADRAIEVHGGGVIGSGTFDRGRGGRVEVDAPTVSLTDGGLIATGSKGSGDAGDVLIRASEALRLDRGDVTTAAAAAGGGRIRIEVGDLIDVRDGGIASSVAGDATTTAGDVTIDPRFLVLDGGRILARADKGRGGSIAIRVGHLIASPDSVIDASAARGIDGTVEISAPDEDVSGGLVALPGAFLDASALLRESCAARGAGDVSSFTAAGRGGLPVGPAAPLPGFYALGRGGDVPAAPARGGAALPPPATAGAMPAAPIMLALSCGAPG